MYDLYIINYRNTNFDSVLFNYVFIVLLMSYIQTHKISDYATIKQEKAKILALTLNFGKNDANICKLNYNI